MRGRLSRVVRAVTWEMNETVEVNVAFPDLNVLFVGVIIAEVTGNGSTLAQRHMSWAHSGGGSGCYRARVRDITGQLLSP